MNQPNGHHQPCAVLRAEHQVILRVIRILDRLVDRCEAGKGFERESLAQCVEFFRLFADACHHAKEEDLLFPVLESRGIPRDGGPIGVMLYEHTVARKFTAEMAEALYAHDRREPDAAQQFRKAARGYSELLSNHIYKEDSVLFNVGDHVMTEEDQRSLDGKFCDVQCRSFGGKSRAQLEGIAADLESRWPG
ncbi:MAG: hemerythrin domain-containing protein [Planctomycetota bacterium]